LKRRTFVQVSGAAAVAHAATGDAIPEYEIVSAFKPAAKPGMPGLYPGQVVSVKADKCIDPETEKVDAPTVHEMISRGMQSLRERKAMRTRGKSSSALPTSSALRPIVPVRPARCRRPISSPTSAGI
jgi:hypothetical protein